MLQWKIGCSGFYYGEWKNTFYPEGLPQRKWFEYYCHHFNAVELNVTFYKFPKLEFFQSWYDRSPNNFTFAVKAPRLITHFKRFVDAQSLLTDFYERLTDGLREKGGTVLFQFPASYAYDPEALERIVSFLSKAYINVLEFRHASWWNENVYSTLAQHDITFCGMSHPELPDDVIQTSKAIYYRFHGVPKLYHSEYDIQKIHQVADRLSVNQDVENVNLFFNNTATGTAVKNARQMQAYHMVHEEPSELKKGATEKSVTP